MTKKARPKAYRQYKLHFHNWEQTRKFLKTGLQGGTALKGKYLKPQQIDPDLFREKITLLQLGLNQFLKLHHETIASLNLNILP